jgi:twinkle protein
MSIYVCPKDVSLSDYMAFLSHQESQSIHGVGKWYAEVLRWAAGDEEETGDALPWGKAQDFKLRPEELTIWAGYRGHHKSFVTGMVAAWLARDVRIGIASFEMPPKDTISRMIRQSAGCHPSVDYCMDWIEAMDPMIRIYDDYSAMTPEVVMAVIHHFAHDLGCGHVFIDSLMKCGIPTDDYTKQKAFVNELTLAAKRYKIHIHLVAHLRKAQHKGGGLPNADDVAGGSDITNLAHNVCIVWNDKEVMELREKQRMGAPISPDEAEKLEQRTHIIKLDKQRNGPDQICWSFWLDPKSMQFTPDRSMRRLEWIPQGKTMSTLASDTWSAN